MRSAVIAVRSTAVAHGCRRGGGGHGRGARRGSLARHVRFVRGREWLGCCGRRRGNRLVRCRHASARPHHDGLAADGQQRHCTSDSPPLRHGTVRPPGALDGVARHRLRRRPARNSSCSTRCRNWRCDRGSKRPPWRWRRLRGQHRRRPCRQGAIGQDEPSCAGAVTDALWGGRRAAQSTRAPRPWSRKAPRGARPRSPRRTDLDRRAGSRRA